MQFPRFSPVTSPFHSSIIAGQQTFRIFKDHREPFRRALASSFFHFVFHVTFHAARPLQVKPDSPELKADRPSISKEVL
jgi:hypothetical protein